MRHKSNLRADVVDRRSVRHNKDHPSSPCSSPTLKQALTTTGSCGFGEQLQTGEHLITCFLCTSKVRLNKEFCNFTLSQTICGHPGNNYEPPGGNIVVFI